MGKLLAFAWCSGFALAALPGPASPSDVCGLARAAYDQEHFAQAAPLFEACHSSSGQLEPILQAAKSYFWSAQYDKAETRATEYLGHAPTSAQAMFLLGHIEERRKQPRDSLQWFTRAAALATPHAGDLRIVALDYVLLNDYPDAIHWLERAVALDDHDVEVWYDLGRAKMTQGDMPGAETALRRALALKPHLIRAEDNLGVVLEAENRDLEALEAYRLAVAWQANDPHPSEQPPLNLGTLLIAKQRAAEALPLLEQAVSLAPSNVRAHEQLARALDAAGQLVAAMQQMNEAVRLDAGNARLHYQLGLMARRAGDLKLAREQLRLSSELYGQTSTSTDR